MLQKLFQDFSITSVSFDSRQARVGDAFFAIKGGTLDGNKFINEVLNKNVKLVITDDINSVAINPKKIVYVENSRRALSEAASIIYPMSPKFIVAATGTNGKTSVTSYCRQLYSLLGVSSSSLGTLGVECSEDVDTAIQQKISENIPSLTTVDPISFRKVLHNLAKHDINYFAFEASSHGLHQERLYGTPLQAAAFTSFSQDHLDYHSSMDAYLEAKLKLFSDNLLPTGVAVINAEIPQLQVVLNYLQQYARRYVTVGKQANVTINRIEQSINGQHIGFIYNNKEYNFSTKIVGSFQASNLLLACMLVYHTGFDISKIVAKLPEVTAVRGRLERVTKESHPFHVFVDYAHTPDALESTLQELRQIKPDKGKLIVVFGCGGNRDIGKRGMMGKAAAKFADNIIVTDDNPRKEAPSNIRKQIIEGIVQFSNQYQEIDDRKQAIITAINNLEQDDILLIAGKGHEEYQIIGDTKIPFNDVEVVRGVL